MATQNTILLNPLFRFGAPAMTAAAIVAIAVLFIDDQTVQATMLLVAAVDIVVTPQVLKMAAKSAVKGSENNDW